MGKKKVSESELAMLRIDWKTIVNCVLTAENALAPEYKQKLQQAKGGTQDEIDAACDEYVTAIVNEILSSTFELL